jgi:hypothetical protein
MKNKPEIQDSFESEISKPISDWLENVEKQDLLIPHRWIKFPKRGITLYLNNLIEIIPSYGHVVRNDSSNNITIESHYIHFLFIHLSFNKISLRK